MFSWMTYIAYVEYAVEFTVVVSRLSGVGMNARLVESRANASTSFEACTD